MEEIKKFLLTELAVDRKSIDPEDNLLSDGIIDSLDITKLIDFLESKFAIRVTDEDVVPENFSSLQTLSDYVERKKKGD